MAELADAEDLKSYNCTPALPKTLSNSHIPTHELLSKFFESRRQGLSGGTIKFYRVYINRSATIIGLTVTSQQVNEFLSSLHCSSGGKHAYYRALRAFYNWLYSNKSGYSVNPQDNPVLGVEPPKVERKILPSLTSEQVDYLIGQASCARDRAIISLFADSGLRLSELANINPHNIDWEHRLIKVRCKGNKEGLAVFGKRTESLLKDWLAEYTPNGRLWNVNIHAIVWMLRKLKAETGLPCMAHCFRRTFASILAKRGVDSLHIMRLGRWESLAMVDRYTKSVRFEDSLKLYSAIVTS